MSAGMDLQTEAPPGCGAGSVYSHRKKRTERAVQSAVTPSMTQIGISMLSVPMPKNVFFHHRKSLRERKETAALLRQVRLSARQGTQAPVEGSVPAQ